MNQAYIMNHFSTLRKKNSKTCIWERLCEYLFYSTSKKITVHRNLVIILPLLLKQNCGTNTDFHVFFRVIFFSFCLRQNPSVLVSRSILSSILQRVIREEKLDPTHQPSFSLDTDGYERTNFTEDLQKDFRIKRVDECSEPQNISGSTVIYYALTFLYLKANYKGHLKNYSTPVAFDARGDYQDDFEIQIVQLHNFSQT